MQEKWDDLFLGDQMMRTVFISCKIEDAKPAISFRSAESEVRICV